MRKKSGLTIIEQAIVLVPEFENVVRKPDQQLTLRGQSKSTLFLFPENFKKTTDKYIAFISLWAMGCSSTWTHRRVLRTAQSPMY